MLEPRTKIYKIIFFGQEYNKKIPTKMRFVNTIKKKLGSACDMNEIWSIGQKRRRKLVRAEEQQKKKEFTLDSRAPS